MSRSDFSKTIHDLRVAQYDAPLPKSRPLSPSDGLACLAARERVEEMLDPFLDELVDEIPELRRHRRLYDGAWLQGVVADLPRPGRRHGPACTRLDFTLQILDAGKRAVLRCYGTVADVELDTHTVRVDLETETAALEALIETACLNFARRWFESQAPGAVTPELPTRSRGAWGGL